MSKFAPTETEIVTSTGRVFKLRDLTAFEQMNADRCAGESLSGAIYYRTAMSIVSVDGETLAPASSDLDLTTRLQDLGGRELDELMIECAKRFSPRQADLKNESTPAA